MEGKKQSHRPGLYYCNGCKGQFTVTVGTVFERSKVPLTKWWLADVPAMNSSKKGYKRPPTAPDHRRKLQNGMVHGPSHPGSDAPGPAFAPVMGGDGGTVEMDTTFVGGLEKNKHKHKKIKGARGGKGKEPVLAACRARRSRLPRTLHVAIKSTAKNVRQSP